MQKKNDDLAEIKPPIWVQVFFSGFGILLIAHAIQTRTVDDFLKYSSRIAIPLLVIAFSAFFIIWGKEQFRKPKREELIVVLFVLFIIPIASFTYYSFGASAIDAFDWFRGQSTSQYWAALTTAIVTIAVGALLFYFRLRLRCIYGLTEVLVGASIAGYKFPLSDPIKVLNDPNFYIFVLTAGVYLVVRGFDNIHVGATNSPPDPIASALLSKIRTFRKIEEDGKLEQPETS